MKKTIYFSVPWSSAKYYRDALDALQITYTVESPSEFLPLAEGHLAFVFAHIPIRLYVKVRMLFGKDGLRYPL
ncbi:hypothetical protein [Brevibacillus dissolubilis]|uniref:hypothetical protein n=1 Tax=Brevibacillus dissolubilis TaxID=1844116 RepID=UPI0011172D3B|nr:hypothetical protein [Brevibacillus dissolubilis]